MRMRVRGWPGGLPVRPAGSRVATVARQSPALAVAVRAGPAGRQQLSVAPKSSRYSSKIQPRLLPLPSRIQVQVLP